MALTKLFNKIDPGELRVFLLVILGQMICMLGIIAVLSWSGGDFLKTRNMLPVFGPDSEGYYQAAKNFLEYGQFSLSEREPLLPMSFRTPGYPFFVVLIWYIFGNVQVLIFIQFIISAISAVFIYRLARKLLTDKLAIVVSVVAFLEPSVAYYSGLLLSETLFTFFLVFAVYIFINIFLQEKTKSFFLFLAVGFILGLATLVKPVAQFLPIVFVTCGFVWLILNKKSRSAPYLLLVFVGFIVVVSPLLVRNHVVFNEWSVSSVASYNLYNYNAPMFYSYKEQVSFEDGRNYFRGKVKVEEQLMMMSLYKSRELKTAALEYISTDWPGYIKFHFIKSLPFFFTDGLRDMGQQVGLNNQSLPNISDYILKKDVVGLIKALITSPLNMILFIGGAMFWGVIILGMIFCLFDFKQGLKNNWLAVIFLIIIVCYFGFLTGPVSNARFRVPVTPLMFIAAFYGYNFIIHIFKNREIKQKS